MAGLIIFLTWNSAICRADFHFKYPICMDYNVKNSLKRQIPVPKGYKRVTVGRDSFSEWIRYLPVKKRSLTIYSYKGRKINRGFYSVWRVLDIPLYFRQDLEQCADWGYRLWFEYQRESGHVSSLWLSDYNGRKVFYSFWRKGRKKPNLIHFFRWTCMYANTYSQKRGLYRVTNEKYLVPGDLIVQNEHGRIGHTSIIFDICQCLFVAMSEPTAIMLAALYSS